MPLICMKPGKLHYCLKTLALSILFFPSLALFDLPPDMVDPGVLPNFEGSIHSAMRLCCEHRTNLPIFSADVGSHILWTLDVYRK